MWMSAAQKLTNIIKQIIEFAKMVPGFMTRFSQEDQIVLLKRGESWVNLDRDPGYEVKKCVYFRGFWACNHTDEPVLRPDAERGPVRGLHAADGSLHDDARHDGDEISQSDFRFCQEHCRAEALGRRPLLVLFVHTPPRWWANFELNLRIKSGNIAAILRN